MLKRGKWFLAVLALTTTAAFAGSEDRWLHIRVMERGDDPQTVKVNLPMTLLTKFVAAIDFEKIDHGRFEGGTIRLDDVEFDSVDLRAILRAVREAEDMDFVTVESDDETVRVAKDGDYIIVKVRSGDEGSEDEEKVDVRLPLDVAEALVSGKRNELRIEEALRILAEQEGDLVRVKDRDSTVRIWIDDKNTND